MKFTRVGFFTFVAVAAYAPIAVAQACVGFPTVDRQFTFGGALGFPDGGKEYGVEVSYNLPGPATVFGGMDIYSPDVGDSRDMFFAGAAFDLLSVPLGDGGTALQVCPTAQVGYFSTDGYSALQVPVGVGIGTTIAVSPSAQLTPYVVPQLVMSRSSFDSAEIDSDTSWDAGLRAGAVVGFGMFYVGGELERIFVDGADTSFGIRAGIRL